MLKEELEKTRQYQTVKKQNRYLNEVPLSFCVRFGISTTELLIYCIIKEYGKFGHLQVYSGSVKGLCAYLNVSKPTVRSALEKLEKIGLIDKTTIFRNGRNWVCYVALSFDMSERAMTLEEQIDRHLEFRKDDLYLRKNSI